MDESINIRFDESTDSSYEKDEFEFSTGEERIAIKETK